MAQANIITWNLGGFRQKEALSSGLQYVQFVATVIERSGADLIGFCGIFDNLAAPFGTTLINELNNRAQKPNKWREQASPQLGLSRNEQYSFVWNSEKLQPAKTSLTDYFQSVYPLPDEPKERYGFPRLDGQSTDMPPFLAYFELLGASKFLPVAIFHAPEWSEYQALLIRMACLNLAQLAAFNQGNGCLLMGTFNVPLDDDVNTPDSNGAVAFGPLAGASGPYTQLLARQPNRLADNAEVAMTMEQALVQTADNFFFRKAANGVSVSNAKVLNVFEGVFGSFTYNSQQEDWQWHTAPLGPALSALQAVIANVQDEEDTDNDDLMTAQPDGSYAKLEDAFPPYRALVSAYMPLMVTVNY
ncbi:hypothetical protein LJ737_13495 [Hymenobacter sp. 15J16-1T3B]|uniref:hypothetical protein n=1 Tax=Hymenobacter sp. 15J16-1T3B TaxID=2886941 RepID=UPI001D110161|nr:hypothetical protein [Hymenobacter sp. 15J16-1T3B]MCC3158257.1 hypothetical protein [Hymenobacter sp. 15J16-1T3B]